MKKVLLFGLAAIFSVALVVTSCSKDDDDETCIDCVDGDKTYELCWEEDNLVDYMSEAVEFFEDHPNAECEEVDDFDLGL